MSTKKRVSASILVVLLVLPIGMLSPVRRDNRALLIAPLPPSKVRDRASATSVEGSHFDETSIILEDGLLSVTLHEQRLGEVLAEIARKAAITIYTTPPIDAHLISMQIHALPFEQGLHRLLVDFDAFFYSTAGELRSVWVYEKHAGMELMPVSAQNWASTADFERNLISGSPAERIRAIETLVAREGPNAISAVNQALTDQEAEVRLRALDVALSAGLEIAPDTLTLLTTDSAPSVRALALEAIASATPQDGPREAETQQLIRRMLGDADGQVRTRAQEILESRRGTAARPE